MSISPEQFREMEARLAKGRQKGSGTSPEARQPLQIIIRGQIMGGKNNIVITRTGHRFPKASWAKWRDDAVSQVRQQLPSNFETITEPVYVNLVYVAGDKRRRDMPAIIDSIWHVLEKSGIVADDTLLWVKHSLRIYSKEEPQAQISFASD